MELNIFAQYTVMVFRELTNASELKIPAIPMNQ
jgi:hypothetical protein